MFLICAFYVWLDIQNHQAASSRGGKYEVEVCARISFVEVASTFSRMLLFSLTFFFTEAQPGKLFLRTNIGVTFEILDGRCAHKWLGCMLQAALGGNP